jgi:predicted component of type VI protein secretion system
MRLTVHIKQGSNLAVGRYIVKVSIGKVNAKTKVAEGAEPSFDETLDLQGFTMADTMVIEVC